MHPITLFVRLSLAFVVVLATLSLTITAPDPAIAKERNKPARAARDEGAANAEDRPEFKIFSTSKTVSRKVDVKERCKVRKNAKRQLCAEGRVIRTRGSIKVSVEPQLGISDYGFYEDVKGRVYGTTNSGARNALRMRIGGALLQGNRCSEVFDDPNPKPTQTMANKKHYDYSPWTDYYRGTNDCWVQTGHNYFMIRMPDGTIWDSFVTADTERDM